MTVSVVVSNNDDGEYFEVLMERKDFVVCASRRDS